MCVPSGNPFSLFGRLDVQREQVDRLSDPDDYDEDEDYDDFDPDDDDDEVELWTPEELKWMGGPSSDY